MSSSVEICNIALIGLGSEIISSLEEQTTQAVTCNTVWSQARRSVLREHPWNHSTKTAELAQLATNTRKYGYDYAYQIPSDSLRVVQVYEDFDYKYEGGIIYTDRTTCSIKYIYDNTDVASFDPLFQAALSMKVKSLIAYTITRERADTDAAKKDYLAALYIAQAADASEDFGDDFNGPDNALTAARY